MVISLFNSVEGTYVGNFTTSSTLKSANIATENMMDTAIVKMMSNGQINVHCFGEALDSTFILNSYHNGDSLMVCLDGQNFEHEYGHKMGDGQHMGGGNRMGNNSSEWGKHMNGEHKVGDQHFGGFDMHNGTFSYSFKMMNILLPTKCKKKWILGIKANSTKKDRYKMIKKLKKSMQIAQ